MSDATYRGRPIVATAIALRKAGDGLSDSVKVSPPDDMEVGDEGIVVFRYKVVEERFKAEKRDVPTEGGYKHEYVLDASTALFIDDDALDAALAEQADRVMRYKAEQSGQHRIDDWQLIEDHDAGQHADGLTEHCPRCASEAEWDEAGL